MWAFLRQPKLGEVIKITWLANPINNPSVKSCYTGYEGIVTETNKNLVNISNNNSNLVCIKSWKYCYKILAKKASI